MRNGLGLIDTAVHAGQWWLMPIMRGRDRQVSEFKASKTKWKEKTAVKIMAVSTGQRMGALRAQGCLGVDKCNRKQLWLLAARKEAIKIRARTHYVKGEPSGTWEDTLS